MMKISDIKQKGFKITWKLLDIGFRGSELFAGELLEKDIIEYAISQLEVSGDDSQIVELSCIQENESDEINMTLHKIAVGESTNYDFELRKWRAMYVLYHIGLQQSDCVQGLISLGDIWAKLDFPDDSPHVYQGRFNSIRPEDYYTDEFYQELYQKNMDWLENEMKYIQEHEL